MRTSLLRTTSPGGTWYEFSTTGTSYTTADLLKNFSFRETHGGLPDVLGTGSYTYSTDGTRRLVQSQKASASYNWLYDQYGNQARESGGPGGSSTCADTDSMTYATDNRLLRRWSPGCAGGGTINRYWTDQAGNRLSQTDSTQGPAWWLLARKGRSAHHTCARDRRALRPGELARCLRPATARRP